MQRMGAGVWWISPRLRSPHNQTATNMQIRSIKPTKTWNWLQFNLPGMWTWDVWLYRIRVFHLYLYKILVQLQYCNVDAICWSKGKVKESGFIFTCGVAKSHFMFSSKFLHYVLWKKLNQLKVIHYLKINCFWSIFYNLLQLFQKTNKKENQINPSFNIHVIVVYSVYL